MNKGRFLSCVFHVFTVVLMGNDAPGLSTDLSAISIYFFTFYNSYWKIDPALMALMCGMIAG